MLLVLRSSYRHAKDWPWVLCVCQACLPVTGSREPIPLHCVHIFREAFLLCLLSRANFFGTLYLYTFEWQFCENKHKDPSDIWLLHTYTVSCGSSFRSTPHQSLTNCVTVVTEIFKACFWHFRVLLSFSSFCSYLTCFWPLCYLFPLGLFWWYNKVAELHYSLITCMCSSGTGRHNIGQPTSVQRTLTEAR